jgi:hypothetical protein
MAAMNVHFHTKAQCTDRVLKGAGNGSKNFYNAFVEAWNKATTLGQGNLIPLTVSCESMPTFDTSTELASQS